MTGARRQVALFSVMVAALLLLFLLGLLLLSGRRERGEAARPAPAAVSDAPRVLPAAPDDAPIPAPAPAAPAPAPPDPKGGYALEVVAAYEDGTPVEGVSFVDMFRDEHGVPEVSLEPDAAFDPETDAEGKCTLRWPRPKSEVVLLVLCRAAEVVGVESGTLVGPESAGEVVAAPAGPGPLRLAMRCRAGCGLVRLLDARTGEPPPTDRARAWWVRHPDGRREDAIRGVLRIDDEGRAPIVQPSLPRLEGGGDDGRVLEVEVAGYEPGRMPLANLRGPADLLLDPKVPSVVGVIASPAAVEEPAAISFSIAREGPAPPEAPRRAVPMTGAPTGEGPFALFDLPDGTWTIRVMAHTEDGPRWAARTFAKAGTTVDLGTIEVSGSASIRARLLDPAGTPVPVEFTVRMDEAAAIHSTGSITIVSRTRGDGGKVVILDRRGDRVEAAEASAPAVDPDGWFGCGGLCPGARYQVTPKGHPYLATKVTTAAGGGDPTPVEFRIPAKMTDCLLRFTARGLTPDAWDVIAFAPADHCTVPADGVFRGPLPAGTQRFWGAARHGRGTSWEIVSGACEIPDRPFFEATVDLE